MRAGTIVRALRADAFEPRPLKLIVRRRRETPSQGSPLSDYVHSCDDDFGVGVPAERNLQLARSCKPSHPKYGSVQLPRLHSLYQPAQRRHTCLGLGSVCCVDFCR